MCLTPDKFTEDCPICLQEITQEQNRKLECGHIFHKECLNTWFTNNYTCPICRTEIIEEKIKFSSQEHKKNLYILFFVNMVEGDDGEYRFV